jgi:23S rRNA pseudouridine2605 synthase
MTDEIKKGDRIAKWLARAGVASRREVERMIAAGRIVVNGTQLDTPAFLVTGDEVIEVDGKPVAGKQPTRLWRYHKPLGLVTSARDEKGRRTVFEELPDTLPRVMSIGRLDINSEGLLLLTNDGELKRKLELPATGWVRKYRVRVNGRPSDNSLEPLRRGVVSEGERFQPMAVSIDRQQGANAWLTIGLREGKNREIRRALEEVDLKVNRLIRTSYGPFQLGDLKSGQVEEVRSRVLRDQLGLDAPADAPQADIRPQKPKSRNLSAGQHRALDPSRSLRRKPALKKRPR